MSARSDWMDAVNMLNVQIWEADTDASVLVITMEREPHVKVSKTRSEYNSEGSEGGHGVQWNFSVNELVDFKNVL